MADTGADNPHEQTSGAVRSGYDAFISYSHAADGLLAPRLQTGLQRFAKPWWRRRALHIFRDETSLSANPHLWSSITEALDGSSWFILLLSPDAANSEWVNQEIDYWIQHKTSERIIPVLTDGDFTWTDGGAAGDAVPPALRGVFANEPRWVDLRFARNDEQLDLSNPAFAAAIADLAAPLRGIPKDELQSEEVKEHRRTLRTAWTAAILVALLGAAAGVFGVQSARNADEAEANARDAEASARDAEAQRRQAEMSAAEAQVQADLAKSRELAASATAVLDDDPELSSMLALESLRATPTEFEASRQGVVSLRDAVLSNLLVARFDDAGGYARISPDGSTLYYADETRHRVAAVDVLTGTERWISSPLPLGDLGRVEVSPDGQLVTISVHMSHDLRVVVLESGSGRVTTQLVPGTGCRAADIDGAEPKGGFSPGGEWFSVFAGTQTCDEVPFEGWVSVYDTTTWDVAYRLNTVDGLVGYVEFSNSADLVLITSRGGTAELRSFPDLELLDSFENVYDSISLSPDGNRLVMLDGVRVVMVDALTGATINFLDHVDEIVIGEVFKFSPDGSRLLVTTRGRDFLFNGIDGRYLTELGSQGQTFSASFNSDATLAMTTDERTSLVWDLAVGSPLITDGLSWVNCCDTATSGPQLAVSLLGLEASLGTVAVVDPESRDVSAYAFGEGIQLSDGRFVITRLDGTADEFTMGPLAVWDPATDSIVEFTNCAVSSEILSNELDADCPEGEPFFGLAQSAVPPIVTPHESLMFAAESYSPGAQTKGDHVIRVWDATSLALVAEFDVPEEEQLMGMTDEWLITTRAPAIEAGEATWSMTVYSLDGIVLASLERDTPVPLIGVPEFRAGRDALYFRDASGMVFAYNTTSWELSSSWRAHDGVIRGWALSDDGDVLATAGEDNSVHLWDVSGILDNPPMEPMLSVPAPKPSDVVWLSDDHLAVFVTSFAAGARWFDVYLSTDDLVTQAKSRLTRGFTETECVVYEIEECPTTLEAIRER